MRCERLGVLQLWSQGVNQHCPIGRHRPVLGHHRQELSKARKYHHDTAAWGPKSRYALSAEALTENMANAMISPPTLLICWFQLVLEAVPSDSEHGLVCVYQVLASVIYLIVSLKNTIPGLPITFQLCRSLVTWIGSPGNTLKLEVAQNVASSHWGTKTQLGSG